MLLLDLSNCGPAGFLKVLYFFKLILDIVFIIIPVALIIIIIIDFSKAIISSDVDAQGKIFKHSINRIIYALIVFFVPTIVAIVNDILGDFGVDYSRCLNNLTIEKINYLDSAEYEYEEAEKYVALAEKKLTDDSFVTAQKYIDNVQDGSIKKQLQERLDAAKQHKKTDSEGTEGPSSDKNPASYEYDGISSSGSCSPGSSIKVLKSEPDPSCAINYWSKNVNKDNFIYPKTSGKLLGAWPKDYSKIPTKLSNYKTYQDGKLIWPVTPTNGLYKFVYEHNGIDIMAPIGTPIYSPASGKLVYSEWGHTKNKGSDETAYTVTIVMNNPIKHNGVTYDTIFLTHMSGIINRCSSNKCNKNVEKGELLGFVGNASGTAESRGYAPHLHMTIYPAGSYSSGLRTSKIQTLYGLDCGSGCKKISKKAGE